MNRHKEGLIDELDRQYTETGRVAAPAQERPRSRTQMLTVAEGRAIGAAFPMAETGALMCGSEEHDEAKLECTRPAGHTGAHLAHVPDGSAVALWPNDEPSR